MVNRDILRLLHIRDAIARIEQYAAIGHERFWQETMTQDAIILQLDLMCEAMKRLSPELLERHPEFPSARMGQLQHELEHNFLNFDRQLAWDVTQETLPELRRTVAAILANEQRQNRMKDAQSLKYRWGRGSTITMDALLTDNRTEILRIAEENGATRVRIFGSFAKGMASPDSDVDVLVDLEPGRSLFDLIAIKHGIEDLLGREVHIVTEAAISPYMRDNIIRTATPL